MSSGGSRDDRMPRDTRIARRKRRLAHALRSAARAHRYLQKILENRDLAGGSVPFSIRKWGAAPSKNAQGTAKRPRWGRASLKSSPPSDMRGQNDIQRAYLSRIATFTIAENRKIRPGGPKGDWVRPRADVRGGPLEVASLACTGGPFVSGGRLGLPPGPPAADRRPQGASYR